MPGTPPSSRSRAGARATNAARSDPRSPAPWPSAPPPRPRSHATRPARTGKPRPASTRAVGARTRRSARSPRAPLRTGPSTARSRPPPQRPATPAAVTRPRTRRRSRPRACDRPRARQRLAPPDAPPEADQLAQSAGREPDERGHVDGRTPRAARQVADLDLPHAPSAHRSADRNQERRRDRLRRDVAAQVLPHLSPDQLEGDVHVAQAPAAREPRGNPRERADHIAVAPLTAAAPHPDDHVGLLAQRPEVPQLAGDLLTVRVHLEEPLAAARLECLPQRRPVALVASGVDHGQPRVRG